MDSKIQKFLDKNQTKYEVVPHRKVYTAFTAAETQGLDAKGVVKIVYIKLSKATTHILDDNSTHELTRLFVAVPAGKRVNLEKVAKAVSTHATKSYKILVKTEPKRKAPASVTAKIASEKDIEKELKTKVGLLHPFGAVWGLPVLVDKKLTLAKTLSVSAGSYTESVEMKTKDFLKLTPHLVGVFS